MLVDGVGVINEVLLPAALKLALLEAQTVALAQTEALEEEVGLELKLSLDELEGDGEVDGVVVSEWHWELVSVPHAVALAEGL